MLLEFEFQNYRSFADPVSLTMLPAKPDATHSGSIASIGKHQVLKVAAIFGANASGKSNTLRALNFLVTFIGRSNQMNPGDAIEPAVPFKLDTKLSDASCQFVVTGLSNGRKFTYELHASRISVQHESLVRYTVSGKKKTIFTRVRTGPKTCEWTFAPNLTRYEKFLRDLTRSNGLALSRGADLGIEPLLEIFQWFQSRFYFNEDMAATIANIHGRQTSAMIRDDTVLKTVVEDFLKSADLGIVGIDLQVVRSEYAKMPPMISEIITETGYKTFFGDEMIRVVANHRTRSGKIASFELTTEESNGTNRLYSLLGPFMAVISTGGVAVIDELDCSLHPLLTRKIVEFFQDPKLNPQNAQLIFTTHDSTMLDSDLFRRDQLWLTEKAQDGSSDLYNLYYDFETNSRPRNNEAFERRYLDGRYGGVPRFPAMLHDLTPPSAEETWRNPGEAEGHSASKRKPR